MVGCEVKGAGRSHSDLQLMETWRSNRQWIRALPWGRVGKAGVREKVAISFPHPPQAVHTCPDLSRVPPGEG